jgi:hypothetical protein
MTLQTIVAFTNAIEIITQGGMTLATQSPIRKISDAFAIIHMIQ